MGFGWIRGLVEDDKAKSTTICLLSYFDRCSCAFDELMYVDTVHDTEIWAVSSPLCFVVCLTFSCAYFLRLPMFARRWLSRSFPDQVFAAQNNTNDTSLGNAAHTKSSAFGLPQADAQLLHKLNTLRRKDGWFRQVSMHLRQWQGLGIITTQRT